ncbi:MAG: hypothetical protein GWN71_32200, partial [Gammaproteobacteria bacterium]|nr:hypothetical protein [Gemmatimonadota bacterium]NIU78049.1 hypothetical protein [Gammaproteobacteria bacterium]NIX41448.1 hypothetical protein [Gemmatimonadota bacterium]
VPLGHSAVGSEEDVAKPIAGDTIELDDRYPDLRPGRMLLVTGKRSGAAGAAVEDSEAVRISSVDHSGERTTVTLTSPLKGSYVRASVRIYGNVAAATHGESVSEVLGDGDASQP